MNRTYFNSIQNFIDREFENFETDVFSANIKRWATVSTSYLSGNLSLMERLKLKIDEHVTALIDPEIGRIENNVYLNLIKLLFYLRLLNESCESEILNLTAEELSIKLGVDFSIVQELLLLKNKEYSNSVFEPLNAFGNDLTPLDKVNVRLDDKLARMMNPVKKVIKEDTILDFIGYLILRSILLKLDSGEYNVCPNCQHHSIERFRDKRTCMYCATGWHIDDDGEIIIDSIESES